MSEGMLNVSQPQPSPTAGMWYCLVMDGGTVLHRSVGFTPSAARRRAEQKLAEVKMAKTEELQQQIDKALRYMDKHFIWFYGRPVVGTASIRAILTGTETALED